MHFKGISVSYDRVRSLATDIANSSIAYWEDVGVVVPLQAVKGAFTSRGFDNIDWNAKAKLAKSSSYLHGTLIAVHQHFKSNTSYEKLNISMLSTNELGQKYVKPLPVSYTEMNQQLTFNSNEKFYVPALHCEAAITVPRKSLREILHAENAWLDKAVRILQNDDIQEKEYISW